jgi:Uma2 family endonuclease
MAMAMAARRAAPLSYRDLQELPDDGYRYELVDGQLLVTPAPNLGHQRCVARLFALLDAAAPPRLEVFVAPVDWFVSPLTVFQPDLLVVDADLPDDAKVTVTPQLVVEVVSPSTHRSDRSLKRDAYADAGVPCYWIVDPSVPSLLALRLVDAGRYEEEALVSGSTTYTARAPFAVTVVPEQLLRRS